MGEAGIAHGLGHLLGDSPALAGNEGCRDLASLSRQGSSDAGVDRGSERIDTGPGRQVPWRSACLVEEGDLACRVTGRAEAGEPGYAGKIEAARLDPLRRGPKRRMKR